MYLDRSQVRLRGKTYTRILLRQSYRHGGKVKHRTVANLSKCSAQELKAIELALKHKHDLSELTAEVTPAATPGRSDPPAASAPVSLRQGLSIGAVAVLEGVARELGLTRALGPARQGRLALWQVIARVIDQGSRLSAVRLARAHAAKAILGLNVFDEDDLYANLDWLANQQADIEKVLFEKQGSSQGLFLYDVTSTYLEGKHNAFGAFGYNRDGKRGKLQIVVEARWLDDSCIQHSEAESRGVFDDSLT